MNPLVESAEVGLRNEVGGTRGPAPRPKLRSEVDRERPRVLVVTKLFPNALRPSFAVFNRQQFAALAAHVDVELLATVPTFPGVATLAPRSDAGRAVGVPEEEVIDGLFVRHPRVWFLPRVGHAVAPLLYTASLAPWVLRFRGKVDLVLGSWAYPDGVAAIMLGRLLGVPSVVKVHGSDLNVLAESAAMRRVLSFALPRAARVVAVSRPLADKAIELGVEPARVAVVRNGVDRALFRPRDRREARRALGLEPDAPMVVYVGRLEREKGVRDLLRAFVTVEALRPDARLALVGGGSVLEDARRFAERRGGRVLVTDARPLEEVATWVAASDVLALPSWNEGTPNVILEAFASGRPVVATNVGGIPDLITSPALGTMVPKRDADALAAALGEALARVDAGRWSEAELVAAAPPDWTESGAQLANVLRGTLGYPPVSIAGDAEAAPDDVRAAS